MTLDRLCILQHGRKFCRPKSEEGLGIRRTQDTDTTKKISLKILRETDNIWVQIIQSRCLKSGSFLRAKNAKIRLKCGSISRP